MTEQQYIMLLSSNLENRKLLKKFLEANSGKEHLEVLLAASIKEAKNIISQNSEEIIYSILDLTNLDKRIWNLCQNLKKKNIEFLLLSSMDITEKNSIINKSGASGLLIKPLQKKQLQIALAAISGNK